MEYKIFRVTYNDGGWHNGDLPHFFYIAHNEEEVKANSKNYAEFKERQDYFGGDIWIREVKNVDFPFEWENLKDFNVSITAIPIGDVAPTKYGEWEPVEEEAFWIHNMEESLETGLPTKTIMPRCSCCKKVFGTIAFDFKYCPECGAKMKEKEK